jgi:2-polyprenyl-6-methoxyphenol hydroxylase-like FAD-dependent oxidoreductase
MNGKDKDRASHMATYQKRSAEEQKDAWKSLYQDAGWECPRFLQGLDTVKDFYATEIGQVKMPQHKLCKDRVVLLGDAGYCPSPFTGMGTTLSLIGAYVLAGELFQHGDDVDAALEAYQEGMKQPVEECQKLGPYADGKGPLPSSEWGLWMAGWALWTVSSLRVDRVIGWLAGLLPEGKEKRWEMPEYMEFNLAALERE